MPTITIADRTTGETRTLNDVMPMYDASVGPSSYHYGNNVYLSDGDIYTIRVNIGQEAATFSDVAVSGGAPLQMPATSPGS